MNENDKNYKCRHLCLLSIREREGAREMYLLYGPYRLIKNSFNILEIETRKKKWILLRTFCERSGHVKEMNYFYVTFMHGFEKRPIFQ